MISCNNSKKLNGIYYYEETKDEDDSFYSMGISMRCSLIGQLEFKEGKLYINMAEIQRRLDYTIEDNTIYVKESMESNSETIINIIDSHTLEFMGCHFIKKGSK
ncbi:hypothetical protein [Mesonia hippocampi]|uniref:hypothetical protein n=1 Tax=Mesonia hippocampi TaxID=1628250 RepID=UPI003F96CDD8